jgi:protein-tyrosine-phosphatase
METERLAIEPFRLLFVCTGNTCRSPMAEVIARRALADLGWSHVEVRSAGVSALEGTPASEGARAAAERHGLDLAAHRSALATSETLAWADLILTMSANHALHLAEMGAADKVALVTSFAGGRDAGEMADSVPDPYGGGDEDYEESFRLLQGLVDRVLRRLAPILAP